MACGTNSSPDVFNHLSNQRLRAGPLAYRRSLNLATRPRRVESLTTKICRRCSRLPENNSSPRHGVVAVICSLRQFSLYVVRDFFVGQSLAELFNLAQLSSILLANTSFVSHPPQYPISALISAKQPKSSIVLSLVAEPPQCRCRRNCGIICGIQPGRFLVSARELI